VNYPTRWRHWVAAALLFPCAAAAETTATLAFATNQKANSVSVLDTQTHKVVATLATGSEPAGVTVSPDNQRVFVSNPGDGTVSIFTVRNLTHSKTLKVGPGPLAIVAGANLLYVADWYEHDIRAIDLITFDVVFHIQVGQSPSGLVLSPDEKKLYVSNRDDNSIMSVDAESGRILARSPTGERPFGITLDSLGERLFVANVKSNSLTVIDTTTMQPITDIAVGDRPYAVTLALADSRAFVTNQYDDTVSVIDTQTYVVVDTIDVEEYPEGIHTHPDDRHVYVANWFSNSVSVIDAESNDSIAVIATGDGTRAYGNFIMR